MDKLKYFGTDGIRGKVGILPITLDFILKLGWVIGNILSDTITKKIIIGKDTRISSCMLESALQSGLLAAGISTISIGVIPTPAISYLIKTLFAEAGVMISASHNHFEDNGIKIFSIEGIKISDQMAQMIEKKLYNNAISYERYLDFGQKIEYKDASRLYIDFCKSMFSRQLDLKGLKIVVDCANGATYEVAPKVLKELGADVIAIFNNPNGTNINQFCGSTDIAYLQKKVILENADIGLAFDGDGDRVIMVDHFGNKVDGDYIIYIIAKYILQIGELDGGVIGTMMSNTGLYLALKELGIPFSRSQVGDRFVLEKMKQKKWKIGAEKSGHVILLDKNVTGDGIIASLQVLKSMINNRTTLYNLCSEIYLFPQVFLNVYHKKNKKEICHEKIKTNIEYYKKILGHMGRIILRQSGTESLTRIMVEGEDAKQVMIIAKKIAAEIKSI